MVRSREITGLVVAVIVTSLAMGAAAAQYADGRVYIDRGRAYLKKGDADRAIADFTQAIHLDPKNADAYEGRGNGYLINAAKEKDSTGRTLGDNDRAIADYTKVIQLDPKNAEAYYNRGIAYYFKGYNDLAIADLTKAKELQDLSVAIADHTKAKKLQDLSARRPQ